MENMEIKNLFKGCYNNLNVLITGHTGFKGSWLCLWLKKLGANVVGLSDEIPTSPNHFQLLNLDITSVLGDIRNRETIKKIITKYKPAIVFHLAAQSLVRESYDFPIKTFETNIMGTANLFEECKNSTSVNAIVNVTSDKCYLNKEWEWGYRENDSLGGFDPYSTSKACSELISNSYRKSFFDCKNNFLATARAGNVIGGGDWAKDRLIPDLVKTANENKVTSIRNPNSTRPWQHVLEPLAGYLQLGVKLLEKNREFATAWNFGPADNNCINVKMLSKLIQREWDKVNVKFHYLTNQPHEANFLKLDSGKAKTKLNWNCVLTLEETIKMTISWYKEFYVKGNLLSENNLDEYINLAINQKMDWTINEN